jgi:hypothetical protein
MNTDTMVTRIYFLRPLNPSETIEIKSQISAFGSVKIKLIVFLSITGLSFLLLSGSYSSSSGFYQTTQGAVVGIIYFIIFLLSLGMVIKTLIQRSKVSLLEHDLKTGLYRTEGQITQLTPQTVKVGNHTFSTKNFSTSDFKIGDHIFIEFSQGTFHVFSLGLLSQSSA